MRQVSWGKAAFWMNKTQSEKHSDYDTGSQSKGSSELKQTHRNGG